MHRTQSISTNYDFTTNSCYRYGFNGKESDNEVKNVAGSSYDFGARMYDSRLGRWFSIDALAGKYPHHSPYVFTADNPVLFVDVDGNEWEVAINKTKTNGVINVTADVTITVKVLNLSSSHKSINSDMRKQIAAAGKGLGGNFKSTDASGNPTLVTVNVNIKVQSINNISELGPDDQVIAIVDKIPGDAVGLAIKFGEVAAIEAGTFKNGSFVEVLVHEEFHNQGAGHVEEGLMGEKVNGSTSVSNKEVKEVYNYVSNLPNGKNKVGGSNKSTTSDELKDFINDENITINDTKAKANKIK